MVESSQHSVPTIADVATHAGVSTATVSRVLNAGTKVQPATRARVEAAISALNYTPNFGARALVAGRTRTIGAVIPTMENAIFARGVQAFQETLDEAGFTLLVATSLYRQDLEETQIRTLMARGIDGLMLIGYQRKPEIYDLLRRHEIATLVTWAHDPNHPQPAVGFDNRAAMADVTRAVLNQGHRDIAVIMAHTDHNDRTSNRLRGLRDEMERWGISPDSCPVVETPYQIDAARRAFAQIMSADTRPTAILCGNDVLAVGALMEARAMGLSVPGDVSLTGFDDMDIATVVEPGITTMHIPHRKMGRQAALALLGAVQHETPMITTRLEARMVMRGSLGPVPPGR